MWLNISRRASLARVRILIVILTKLIKKGTHMEQRETYNTLGLKPIINANATLTRLGGSRMPAAVVEAMAEASRHFVDLDELQRAVGGRLAELTGNEAAYVSTGAAAGLTLAAVACMVGTDPTAMGCSSPGCCWAGCWRHRSSPPAWSRSRCCWTAASASPRRST